MFNNPFSMVVAIVAIVSIASIIRARYGLARHHRRDHRESIGHDTQDSLEIQRLREEVKGLKDRVAVLERLATDSSSALDREFDKLRRQD